MVVWALFDCESCSCYNALIEHHEVYSFGIGNGIHHFNLDLSNFTKASEILDKFPKADIIFASPPCETWVPLSIGAKRFYTKDNGFNFYWKDKWTPFDFTQKAKNKRLNGCNTALVTAAIIQYYSPRYWAIENGSRTLIFDFLESFSVLPLGYRNKCNYYSYGLNVLKPTIFYSNIILELKNNKPNVKTMPISQLSYKGKREMREKYGSISQVPALLYQDIMQQFRTGGKKNLFSNYE